MKHDKFLLKSKGLVLILVLGTVTVFSFVSLIYGVAFDGVNPALVVQDVAFLVSSAVLTVLYLVKLIANKTSKKVFNFWWVVWMVSLVGLVIYYV